MARSTLGVTLTLDRIVCHDEGDGWGSAEPYLWTVFFKVDGDTVFLGDDLFLHGNATIVTTPGSHGNLGDTDVDAGDVVAVPAALGNFSTSLRPIPVPSWVTESFGVEDVGGVVGVATVLMEEDWVSDGGAEAGHAALNQFVQQAIDALIPTLGVAHPEVTDDDIKALTAGAETAIANAVQAAQSGWDNFTSWLNSDDQIGNKVFTFSHDRLAANVSEDFSERWRNEGDWELVGDVLAVPQCPMEATMMMMRRQGIVDAQTSAAALTAIRGWRKAKFAGNRELGTWWGIAQRNAPAIARVLHRDRELTAKAVAPAMAAIAAAAGNPEAPIPPASLTAIETLLKTLADKGSRRLRIDAKAALSVLPDVKGKGMTAASGVLTARVPTRKIKRLPRPIPPIRRLPNPG